MNKIRIIAVLGYGCHLSDKMKEYLDLVVKYTKNNSVDLIITTGGFTNQTSAPNVSEADMMADYLISQNVKVEIIREKQARTTTENLKNIKEILTSRNLKNYELIIFCETAREFKVKILSRLILKFWITTKAYPLNPSWKRTLKQILIGTPFEVLSLYIPLIEKLHLKQRENIMKVR